MQAGKSSATFEQALQGGFSPLLEDYLPALGEPRRALLLRELLAVEVRYRRSRGEPLDHAEYLRRFPDLGKQISAVFAENEATVASSVQLLDETYVHTSSPAHSPLHDSPRLADYEILGELGRGGMGVVYKARQIGLGRTVALKMVRKGCHASDDDIARFQAEAAALARIQHANIIQIFECGSHDGQPYFSLEIADGGTADCGSTPATARFRANGGNACPRHSSGARGRHHSSRP